MNVSLHDGGVIAFMTNKVYIVLLDCCLVRTEKHSPATREYILFVPSVSVQQLSESTLTRSLLTHLV